MMELTQLLKECMDIHKCTVADMAEAMQVSVEQAQAYIDGRECPEWESVRALGCEYGTNLLKLKKSWEFEKKARNERLIREKRKEDALTLLSVFHPDMRVSDKILVIIALAQYYHNAYRCTQDLPETVRLIIDIRNEAVYSIGSDKYFEYCEMLESKETWNAITEELRKLTTS